MSKAFTREDDQKDDDDDRDEEDTLPPAQKNYVTPAGLAALNAEYKKLFHEERPQVVQVVSWAAGNGDRSENGDYIYGKRRLREIDRRVRYLLKRIDNAELVDPKKQQHLTQIFFGATVEYARDDGVIQKIKIVGIDEANVDEGKVSWLSPIARALQKARAGDVIELRTPAGKENLEIISISYPV